MKKYMLLIIVLVLAANSFGQSTNSDTAYYQPWNNPFYIEMINKANDVISSQGKDYSSFKVDLSEYLLPSSTDQFTYHWHNDPISQGLAGTCWAFSATSFMESEIFRITGKKVKLSEIYSVYWEYVDKAAQFIDERGEDSFFGQGSMGNAVLRLWKDYGIVPEDAYLGKQFRDAPHDHRAMHKEMEDFLNYLKTTNAWNKEEALNTIKSIMNHYLGTPPETFEVDGVVYTPQTYLNDYLKLNLDDYNDFASTLREPYFTTIERVLVDNWFHGDTYKNVPLELFLEAINSAITSGFTVYIAGDVSEPGIVSEYDAAVIPTFDIATDDINALAREMRFKNEATTDDHAIHLVGYTDLDNGRWYMIKDSGAGAFVGKNFGYYFYHEDYVRLKTMELMIHKDAVQEILEQF